MSQFTHTDTGVFRQCLLDAKVSNGQNQIYNDTTGSQRRRLKAENYSWGGGHADTAPAAIERLRVKLQAAFGKRFERVAVNQYGAICLYLNDLFGGPFQIVPKNPTRTAFPKYKRPPHFGLDKHEAFWAEALGKSVINKWWQVHVTKHDIACFKKAYIDHQAVIVNLIIPAGSRVHVTAGKCRADQAKVVSIFRKGGSRAEVQSAYSGHDATFKYVPGTLVKPKNRFGGTGAGDCAGGIHFFIDVNRALDY